MMATTTNSQTTNSLKQPLNISSAEEPKAQQPDIEYQPDRAKWEARTARRLAADPSLPTKALPDGFPKELKSPLVWEGSDWTDEKKWAYQLTAFDLSEIADAVTHFKSTFYCCHLRPFELMMALLWQASISQSGSSRNPPSRSILWARCSRRLRARFIMAVASRSFEAFPSTFTHTRMS